MTSRGVLLFALNNEQIDYTKLAVFTASKIKKFLNVPVAVATDDRIQLIKNDINGIIDTVIDITKSGTNSKNFYDGRDSFIALDWNNTSRYTCFDISPYDETLVIDVDYILNSDVLSYCWDTPHDFLIYKDSFNLSGSNNSKYITEYSIPFYWATVFYFKKTAMSKSFFELIEYIKDNWNYYRLIYQIADKKFRNDFAFSIAINMFNGFAKSLPGKLYYSYDTDYVLSVSDSCLKLLVENNNSYIPIKVSNIDVHIMNKFSLLRNIND